MTLTLLWLYHRGVSSTDVRPCKSGIKQPGFLLEVNGAMHNALQK